MLRVGVMLDFYLSSAWITRIVQQIQASGFARIELVVLNDAGPSFKRKLRRRLKFALFRLYEQADYWWSRANPDALAATDLTSLLEGVPCLAVHPVSSGFTDRIPDEELAAIHGHQLDVLFRFGFRILRGPILDATRCGVWSFHHGDNRLYRGGPALFWEIYEGNPVSGTMLQILTEELDGGRVICRGSSATHLTSLYRNRNRNYWKTADFAMRRLRDVDSRGFAYIQALSTCGEQENYTRGIYHTPGNLQMVRFLGRLLGRWLKNQAAAARSGGHPRWFLAIRPRKMERRFDDAAEYRLLLPPKGQSYADPFLVEREGKTWLFFESLRFRERWGVISCSELGPDGKPGEPIEVLRRPYHLSYPFVFEHEAQVYMIPETRQNRTIELYRATSFPEQWALDAVLLSNICAVDATLARIGGKFWLFAGISNGMHSNSDELGVFFADALTGPWTPHPSNPVVSDVRRSRPAGALFYDRERLIRPSQDCSRAYGYALVFSEIVVLTETEYEERPIARIDPGWTKGNRGTHTYSRSERFEAIDGNLSGR
jgi:hypothetical protein